MATSTSTTQQARPPNAVAIHSPPVQAIKHAIRAKGESGLSSIKIRLYQAPALRTPLP